MDDLKERLRKVEGSVEYGADPGGTVTCWHRNPDGPEAATYIEALEQRVSELSLLVEERLYHLRLDERAKNYHERALAALNREPNP